MPAGRLVAIWIKRFKGGPMDAVREARLEAGAGLLGNANVGGRRQVTLLEREIWDEVMRELEADLPPSARRANLLVEGLPLVRSAGRVVRIGAATIAILGPTQPCNLMEETWPGLEGALRPDWRGGAFGQVLAGGGIAAGDAVAWEEGVTTRLASS